MSTLSKTGEAPVSDPASTSHSPQTEDGRLRPRRQQACVFCQKRKVKCDHNNPCAMCVKNRIQCVPANQIQRQRKRRFPERELLDRIRKYEEILTKHNISFEPLHPRDPRSNVVMQRELPESEDEPGTSTVSVSSPATTSILERPRAREAKRMLDTMNQEFRDRTDDDSSDDEVRGVVFKKAWDQTIANDDHLLFGFGSQQTIIDMYTLHPQPFQIFQLWQVYLDNVDPLLKVTHTPSLQRRIMEAAANVLTIKSELEALMFGIYCMAVISLTDDGCQTMFGSSKSDLLAKFQLGCQQALLKSRFMRSADRDCLTALCLYLMSVRPTTSPQSLSSMLGIAVHIGQRMGIHSEAVLAKRTPLEAEMSRRIWWTLLLFDNRIGEMADMPATSLLPTWDCRVPLATNDPDLREEMKDPPQPQGKPTDVLFVVCRSELADFVRHAKFHLGFYGPGLKPIDTEAGQDAHESEMEKFASAIEDKWLKNCDPDNPVHLMTILTTRGHVAKYSLMEHHFRYSGSPLHQAEDQRNAALSHALRMLECNTKLMESPLIKGFNWMVQSYFPFIAYVQIVQHLKWRPLGAQATEAWKTMDQNYHAVLQTLSVTGTFFKLLTNMILQAWEAREEACKDSGEALETPPLVTSIQHSLTLIASDPGSFGQACAAAIDPAFTDYPTYYDVDMNHLDWSTMDWDLGLGELQAVNSNAKGNR